MPLPKLTGGLTLGRQNKPPTLGSRSRIQLPAEGDKYAPRGLSGSREEEWIWRYLQGRRGYWRQQVIFGNPQERFSSIADFVSDYYRAVLYPEGLYVHRNRIARDLVKYSLVRQRGYRVFVFYFPTFDYVVKNFPTFYNQNFTS